MSILEKLDQDYNQAFKNKNELAVLVLRQLKTVLTNAEIAKNRQALSEEEVLKIFKSEVKKRKEASELYQKGNRPELAQKEQQEIEIINQYLPPELGEAEIREKIIEVITQVKPSGLGDLGKVMGLVMKALGGAADGNVVSRLVKEELSKPISS